MIKIKNIRDFKSSLLGLILIGVALYYLIHLERENNTIFFGLIIIGAFLIFAPDTIFKSGAKVFLRMLGITTKTSSHIEIDDSEENEIPPHHED